MKFDRSSSSSGSSGSSSSSSSSGQSAGILPASDPACPLAPPLLGLAPAWRRMCFQDFRADPSSDAFKDLPEEEKQRWLSVEPAQTYADRDLDAAFRKVRGRRGPAWPRGREADTHEWLRSHASPLSRRSPRG